MKGYQYNGKKYGSYRAMAEADGIPPYLLYNRICNSVGKNMTIEEAIQTPIKNASEGAAKPITVNGVNYRTQSEAMQAYGIKVGHFYRTLKLCGGDKELAFKQCIEEGKV